MEGLPLSMRHVRTTPRALALAAVAAVLVPASAHADRSFTARYATTDRGQVGIIANTLESCPSPAPGCSAVQNGTTSADNGSFSMSYVDVDSDSATFDSSRATLALPTGATVLWAGLYWAGDTSAGTLGAAAPTAASRNRVRFATPSAAYATVTSSVLDVDAASTTRYQAFADVTTQVKAAGNGAYAVANVQSGTGVNRWAGWALVVVYRDSSQPIRRLQVYDGLQVLQSGGTTSGSVPLSDFLTPAGGTVTGRLGILSWEGDRGQTGDSATLGTRALSDAVNPASDFMNSTISRGAANVTARSPSYTNLLGVDADDLAIDGLLGNGASSATLSLATSGDLIVPGVVTLTTDEGPPAATTAPSMSGSPIDGSTLNAARGTWSGTPTVGYAYQWRRCDTSGANCADIAGATTASYALTAADVGSTIRVAVTATNGAGSTTSTSTQSARVTARAPVNATAPSVSGAATDGATLTLDRGTWTGTPTITYAYQWRRCDTSGANCADIAGATALTYALTSSDVGKTLRAAVTATNAAGSTSAATIQTATVSAAAPANTAGPTITGTARDAQLLSVIQGTWTGTPTIAYAYQWRRCDASGASCTNITGATAASYALTSADVGSTVRAVVTATNAAGSTSATAAQTATVAAAAPANTVAPAITGTARDGSALTVGQGTWTGTPTIAYAHQWRRCDASGASCGDIAGATSSTYALTSADVGKTIRAVVTATNAGGSTSAMTSRTAAVAALAPSNDAAPALSGTARDGSTLTVDKGTWTGTPTIAYAYQWRRCDTAGTTCADIAGGTNAGYTLTSDDVGRTVRAVVTATNAAGATSAATAQTATVSALAPANTALPSIAGTTTDGQTVVASSGTWSGTPTIAYAYQWRRCDTGGVNCTDIAGATSAGYALTGADVGATVRVRESATNSAGTTTALSTASTTVNAAPPVNTAAPAITGAARHGSPLTVSQGAWTGTPTIAYAYQWRRCDATGANCTDIAGATSPTYTPTSDDVGGSLRASVTATNAGGASSAATAATGTVAPLAPANDSAPTLSGTARDGSTLTVDKGAWSGTPTIAYTYQWRRCDTDGTGCTDIAGATGSTYALTATDVGRTVRAVVTAANTAGATSAATVQTATVAALAPANSALPSIAGTATDGQTLLAANGTWTGTPTIAYAYQWRRCDTNGATCTDIAGATSAAYALTSADVAGTVRVRVSATNSAGTTTALSAATATVAPAAPVNTATPTEAGTMRDGSTLTVDRGAWSGTPTIAYAYQWRRCDAGGANCADIAGATSTSYVLAPADVGRTIRAAVTASNDGGAATAVTAASATIDALAPINDSAPALSGTARDGSTLAVDRGAWTGTPTITYAYQWRRCDTNGAGCTDIAGATASTYTLTSADAGTTVRAVVTATNAGGSASAPTGASATVAAAAPVNTVAPAVSGTAGDGQTLSVTTGTWTGTPTIGYAYQWQRCDSTGAACTDIAGASGSAYALASTDVGKTIRAAVTATNAGGSATARSATSTAVTPAAPANTVAPTATGTARDGQTLTATAGSWTGTPTIAYAYQWRRCDTSGANCADIAAATGTTYMLTGADVVGTVRVRVTATNAGGAATADSAPTATVAAAAPASTTAPTISGLARDGQTVSAAPGTWSGTPPLNYAYQWLRCDAAGGTCSDIPGATASSYTLTVADVSGSVRVRVTATNAGGSASATSARAAVDSSAPVNTAPPTISGTAGDGQTLSESDGTWTGTSPSFTRQWLRCDASVSSCTAIPGAAATTYTLTSADVGGVVRVAVTASNSAGAAAGTSSPTAVVAGNAPVNTTAPAISGTARDAAVLTVSNGTWSGTTPIGYAYQWRRCDTGGANCIDIGGATASTYTLASADAGSTVRAAVTATNVAGSATTSSTATATVAPAPPAATTAPSVSGTARDGSTMTADRGAWSGTPTIGYAYQWRRCDTAGAGCTDIDGATASTYTLTSADVGGTLRVAVTATNAAASTTATSAATAIAIPVAPIDTAPPTLSGTARDGSTLTADRGAWSGTPTIDYAYQWRRCAADGAGCTDIAGATGPTYALTSADVGSTVRVTVTASNAAGGTSAATAASAVVDPLVAANTTPPAIAGTTADGATLTATTGTWNGTPPIAYAYQWQRCDADGNACQDLAGATDSSYGLGSDDVGARMRVVVTAANAGGSATQTSSATAAIAATAPVNRALPDVSGGELDGQLLTSSRGAWTGTTPLTYIYQWERCDAAGASCTEIAGATRSTYTLTSPDAGHALRVRVTATNTAGSATEVSGPTGAIAAVAPVVATPPAVTGTRVDGHALAVDPGAWSGTIPIAYAYRWQRCDDGNGCDDIPGATASTYALTAADVDHAIRAIVTATNAAGSASTASAAAGPIEPSAPDNVAAPAIAGTTTDLATLTATTGTWNGTTPVAYAYQWQRCDADGNDCVDIDGATAGTYTLATDDVDDTIRVSVTANNAGGTASRVSPATAIVAATAPANTAAPTIAGGTRDGQLLTSSRGTWTGTAPISYAYQWQRCDATGASCTDIAGATRSTHTLTSADTEHAVRLVVTAANTAGTASALSDPSDPVAAVAPVVATPPVVTGTRVDGQALTVDPGAWSGTVPIAYAYRWQRCDDGNGCDDIPGATATTYTLTSADVDHAIRAIVTATNAAGSASTASAAAGPIDAAGPVSATAPALAGTAVDGATLTASDGTWTGTPTIAFAHQWQRCNSTGAGCADVAGATASSYTLTSADVGRTLRDRVTATNAGGSAAATSATSSAVAAAGPVSVDAPAITGGAVDGSTLTATDGTWTGTPTLAYAHQWQRCDAAGASCVDITGAITQSYTLSSADVGATVRDEVTASNAGGSATRASLATATVAAAPPVATTAPSIAGTERDGATLTLDRGTWTGTPTIAYDYQWQRCGADGTACADIAAATATTYTLTSADVGHAIGAVVAASNAGGTQREAATPTALVVAAAPAIAAVPTIAGEARDGQLLTADRGTWSGTTPMTYAYQWQRCEGAGSACADIAGATGATYRLTSEDAGRALRVAVTARNVAGAAREASAATAAVAANAPVSSSPPAISGTTRDGQTLTAAPGAWAGTTPVSYRYQWRRCDSAGTGCSDIAGATDPTYVLTSEDVGRAIRVMVTAVNAAGSASATSDATDAADAQGPISLVQPVVSGTARDGETLSADRGTWSGTPTIAYAYRWQRCDLTGSGCIDIAGATSQTYDLTSADVGGRVRVAVDATNAAGTVTRASGATTAIDPAGPAATGRPVVSGTARDGFTLTADHGAWSGTAPIAYAYRWQRCDADVTTCIDVAGATSDSYVLSASDVDSRLRVVVTASNAAGADSAPSLATDAVAPLAPAVATVPVISGAASDGSTLTATHGTWSGTAPLDYAYQWRRCAAGGSPCSAIDGADQATYALTSDDVGHALRVEVTATNRAGSARSTSNATADVAPTAPTSMARPVVDGAPRIGQTLHADHGRWDGTTPLAYAYQWQRCDADGNGCVDLAGEADPDHAVVDDDRGHALRVVVRASNVAGAATRPSLATDVVTGAPAILTAPEVSGAARDGATLTADRGTWSGDPTSYAYRWQRCAADGTACADIPGATAPTYTLTPDDVGHAVRVAVIAANAEGSGTAAGAPAQVAARRPTPTVDPTVSGSPATGVTLTADRGAWDGTAPIAYAYRWQRCDADGGGCTDIAGATGATYAVTGDDAGHALRVVVTASNAGGDAVAASAPTGAVPSLTRPSAPATGQGSPPNPTPATPDLSTLTGSLVSNGMCQTVAGARATRRLTLPSTGTVFLRVRADTVVAPDSPLRVTVATPRGRAVAARATLDGRALALSASRPRAASIAPARLGQPGTHVLAATLTAGGKTRTVRVRLRSASCAARYTARQGRRTAAGTTTVRLRVDSRTALTALSLPLPPTLRLQAGATPRRAARLRVVVAGGAAKNYALTLPASKRSGALAMAPTGPRVTFGPTGLKIGALPAGAGIVELTEAGVTGLAPGRTARLTARASGTGGRRTLTATLRGPRR